MRHPPPGLRHTETVSVTDRLTVPAVAAAFGNATDIPPVFATAFLVAFAEWTCVAALRPFLEPHERTVGTLIEMSHVAATPVGMTVTAEAELEFVEGRRIRFKVSCRDEAGPVGAGFHERGLIDVERFMGRLAAKTEAAKTDRAS